MMISKWQECPVCVNLQSPVRAWLCQVCNNELIIHLETGMPPSKHRAFVAAQNKDTQKTDEVSTIESGVSIGCTLISGGSGITTTVFNPNNPHTLTGTDNCTPTGEKFSIPGKVFNHDAEYDPELYKNINDRIPRMKNPPLPPPIKTKHTSHVL